MPAFVGNFNGDQSGWKNKNGENLFGNELNKSRKSLSLSSKNSAKSRSFRRRKQQKTSIPSAKLSVKDQFKRLKWHEGLQKFQIPLEWKHSSSQFDPDHEKLVKNHREIKRKLSARK